jgi:hypothetical protein
LGPEWGNHCGRAYAMWRAAATILGLGSNPWDCATVSKKIFMTGIIGTALSVPSR